MTTTRTPADIFADARAVHAEALARLEAGDIRDAAEKAWCAVRRATEALVIASTAEVPTTTTQVSGRLRALGQGSEASRLLQDRFGATARFLHNDCFYNGNCEPLDDTERRIREASQYIEDAEALASGIELG